MFKTLKSAISLVDRATNVRIPDVNINVRQQARTSLWIDYPDGRVYYSSAEDALDGLLQRFNDLGAEYDALADDYNALCEEFNALVAEYAQ